MANRIWRFSSVPHQPSPDAVTHLWQWRVGVDGAVVSRSPKFFQRSMSACEMRSETASMGK